MTRSTSGKLNVFRRNCVNMLEKHRLVELTIHISLKDPLKDHMSGYQVLALHHALDHASMYSNGRVCGTGNHDPPFPLQQD